MKNKIVGFLNKGSANSQPAPIRQGSFGEDNDDSGYKPTKGISLDNSQSKINVPQPAFNISENAKAILINQELRKRTAVDLTIALINMFKDKTLDENKDIERKKFEKQLLTDYVVFVKLLNEAEDEEDGAGTLGFTLALMKVCVAQRDRINELDYNVKTLSLKIDQLLRNNNPNQKP